MHHRSVCGHAINIQVPACCSLLGQGARVIPLVATFKLSPNGYLHEIYLLIVRDTRLQYLYLLTHSHSPFYMPYQPIFAVLMWAVNQDDARSVELLLEHDTNINS